MERRYHGPYSSPERTRPKRLRFPGQGIGLGTEGRWAPELLRRASAIQPGEANPTGFRATAGKKGRAERLFILALEHVKMFEMEQTFVISHPYYPQHALIPNYVPNATPLPCPPGLFWHHHNNRGVHSPPPREADQQTDETDRSGGILLVCSMSALAGLVHLKNFISNVGSRWIPSLLLRRCVHSSPTLLRTNKRKQQDHFDGFFGLTYLCKATSS